MSSSSSKRGKRAKKSEESDPGMWECTVCTYQNPVEAFKCEMCDTRKGTSTRKPRLSSNVVEQHTIVQNFVVQQEQQQNPQGKVGKKHSSSSKTPNSPPPVSTTPTHSRSTLESPSDRSLSSSADQSPSTSKNPTPQPATPPACAKHPEPSASPQSPKNNPPSEPSTPEDSACQKQPVILPQPSTPSPGRSPVPNSASLPATPSSSNSKIRVPKGPKTDAKQTPLRNIDKNSARSLAVTVNGTTVVITDYRLKPQSHRVHKLKKSKSEPAGSLENKDGTVKETANGISASCSVETTVLESNVAVLNKNEVKNEPLGHDGNTDLTSSSASSL